MSISINDIKQCSRCHSKILLKYFGLNRKGEFRKCCNTCRDSSKQKRDAMKQVERLRHYWQTLGDSMGIEMCRDCKIKENLMIKQNEDFRLQDLCECCINNTIEIKQMQYNNITKNMSSDLIELVYANR